VSYTLKFNTLHFEDKFALNLLACFFQNERLLRNNYWHSDYTRMRVKVNATTTSVPYRTVSYFLPCLKHCLTCVVHVIHRNHRPL